MANFELLILSNAAEGKDEQYNKWYDETHIFDVCAVPGVTSARRCHVRNPRGWNYTAVYDLDCDNPEAVVDEILARWKTDKMPASDTLDEDSFSLMIVESI